MGILINMKKYLVLFLGLLITSNSQAAFNKCTGVYVGRIGLDRQGGLNRVVFLEKPGDVSGSFWVLFTDWEAEPKQQALSVLMAAKLSGHRVDVYTTAANNCNIGESGQVMVSLELATNP